MRKPTWGPIVKERARHFLEASLSRADALADALADDVDDFQYRWEDNPGQKLVVETKRRCLERLTNLKRDQIYEVIEVLKILEILEDNRIQTQGKEDWHFTLRLWSKDIAKNLSQFDREWENKRSQKLKTQAAGLTLPTIPQALIGIDERPLPSTEPEFPVGQVPLASGFYVERPPIEERCYQEILQPGALLRIKAPRLMGKTSLMSRILYQAREHGYQTVPLSFQLADRAVFTNLDTFLRWFCESIGRKLKRLEQLDNYWSAYGSKDKSTAYFEECLLAEITSPLLVSLDGVDRLFPYRDIADDFFSLLRAWYEYARYGDSSSEIWKKLRLVLVHCKEVYIPLDMNWSFN